MGRPLFLSPRFCSRFAPYSTPGSSARRHEGTQAFLKEVAQEGEPGTSDFYVVFTVSFCLLELNKRQ